MRDLIVDMLSAAAVGLLALLAVVMSARFVRGDESTYWRAKVATAIALRNSATVQSGKPVAKPVVTMYWATWCQPCGPAKDELKKADLPFDLKFVDVTNGGHPDWCDRIPAFAWDAQGQTRYVIGFTGVDQLVARWKKTRTP